MKANEHDAEIGASAVRVAEVVLEVVKTLRPFSQRTRARILRWAIDKCEEDATAAGGEGEVE